MIKKNSSRKSKFQLKTVLDRINKVVYKQSISESELFLESFTEKYEKLNRIENNEILFNKILKKEEGRIFFSFIEGKTLEEKIDTHITEKTIFSSFDTYIDIIDIFQICEKKGINESEKIFGKSVYFLDKKQVYLKSGVLDLILSNVIIDGDKNINVIDYEWVFDFPINKKYVIWRSIYFYLYKIHKENNIDVKKIYKHYKKQLGVSIIQEWLFINMEYNFQRYVNEKKPSRIMYLRVFYIMTLLRFSRLYNR